jgi:uncharacterized MAPEG superfamily protein
MTMTPQLMILGWTLVLAIVQILLASAARTQETGIAYNAGPRDAEGPPPGKMTARLKRAQNNLYETLPLFIAAVLIANVAHRDGPLTLWGSGLYLGGRIVYVPFYAFGITGRPLIWIASLVGLALVLWAILKPA